MTTFNYKKASLILLTLTCMLLLIFSIYYYTFLKKIDVFKDAIVYIEDSPSDTVNSQINIFGQLHRSLFGQDKFTGHITINSFEITIDTVMHDIYITKKENGINMGALVYESHEDIHSKINIVGSGLIWFDDNFNYINIWTSPTWSQLDTPEPNMYIVVGESYEQALQNQHYLRESFGSMFVPK